MIFKYKIELVSKFIIFNYIFCPDNWTMQISELSGQFVRTIVRTESLLCICILYVLYMLSRETWLSSRSFYGTNVINPRTTHRTRGLNPGAFFRCLFKYLEMVPKKSPISSELIGPPLNAAVYYAGCG